MSFLEHARTYQARFRNAVETWDLAALEQLATLLGQARARGSKVLICGNGGSAAIANHAECDVAKGTHGEGSAPLDARSLSSNPSVLTALANDLGYDTVFEKQVEYYGRPGDVLLVVSSKGSSPNVVAACRAAKARGLVTVAMVGFDGGRIRELADYVIHVPTHDYGVVEDMHQASLHLVTQWLKQVAK